MLFYTVCSSGRKIVGSRTILSYLVISQMKGMDDVYFEEI
jgi:hypothetical protein